MPFFVSKAIFWNATGYKGPSGHRASSGFPREYGYGHEEWNNSSDLLFGNGLYRAFYTKEGIGNDYIEHNGRILLFMYASHDGVQELVGVAGNATYLFDDRNKSIEIAEKLNTINFIEMAWDEPRVKRCFNNSKIEFRSHWKKIGSWIPTWCCSKDDYLWFDTPVPLDPDKIRGRKKFLTEYQGYTLVDQSEALRMMNSVLGGQRSPAWYRIRRLITEQGDADIVSEDIRDIENRSDINKTTRQCLIDARRGQGAFRQAVESIWGGRCTVSDCGVREVLRASHIKPWKDSDDEERLDPNNGLLLSADLDALFDRGLISFNDHGDMLISEYLSEVDRNILRIPRSMRRSPSDKQKVYLQKHRRENGFS